MNNVLCVYTGDRYDISYVIKLRNMVERNLPQPYRFYCLTDHNDLKIERINIIQIPNLGSWWSKMMMFSDLGLPGTNLYLDLDIVIFRNIESLFHFQPESLLFYGDPWSSRIKDSVDINTSVIRFDNKNKHNIWNNFIKNKDDIISRFIGDQDYLRSLGLDCRFWPEGWIKSYKYDVVEKHHLIKGAANYLNYFYNYTPKIENSMLAVMHGHPKNHNIRDSCMNSFWK